MSLQFPQGTKHFLVKKRQDKRVLSQEANSGEFTRDPDFKIPSDGMKLAINARLGPDSVQYLSSQMLAISFWVILFMPILLC